MSSKLELKNRNITISGPLPTNEMQFLRATVKDGLSQVTEITVEFVSDKATTKLEDILGERLVIELHLENEAKRLFAGHCISVEYLGLFTGMHHYTAQLRPWLWFLTRSEENRIYQSKKAVDIIKEIFGDYGFSGNLDDKLTGTYAEREYCVQYGETDFAFVSRLMEEEGIYYFFDVQAGMDKIVLADGVSAHEDIPVNADIEFYKPDGDFRRDDDHIWEWSGKENLRSGKITLNDYDFQAPGADQKKVKAIPKGKHGFKNYEKYRYPGHVRPPTSSDAFARVVMEAEAIEHKKSYATGNVRTMYSGGLFNLKLHDIDVYNASYMVVSAVHELQSQDLVEINRESYSQKEAVYNETPAMRPLLKFEEAPDIDSYRCRLEVVPAEEQFRAPLVTPWPRIAGLQTALVTGPSGEEIYTDEYGRIKVQFHWDRDGKKDENTTCWVRVVMPWTGKNWGMISIPRIGNEVVVQFEEGDPDRPICTGMIYNADNKPPYELPANMTQTGIKTRSSKQGGTDNYHEMVFEDKKGSEYVRMQSERDYLQVIKNNALINIGGGHKKEGDLTQIVHRNKTEVVGEVRTHVVGLLDDLTVGMVYDEAVGMVKTQTVGIYKEEKIGLTMPSLKNVVSDVLSLAITIGGPISTLAYGGKYADIGAAATGVNSLLSGRKAGKKEEINGTSQLIVTGDRIETISKSKAPAAGKEGNVKTVLEDGKQDITLKKGNRTLTLDKGDLKTQVKKGDYKNIIDTKNYSVDVKKGKVTITAKMAIELKVGSNSIKIDPAGITLKGSMIKNEAKAVFKAEGKMTTVSGDMTMIDGKMVMIN